MKKILTPSILFFVIPALALAGSTVKLPDYEKDAELWLRLSCDKDGTIVTSYKKESPTGKRYIVEVTVSRPGDTFYIYESEEQGKVLYFIKLAGTMDIREIPRNEWREKLNAASPESDKDLQGLVSDCREVK